MTITRIETGPRMSQAVIHSDKVYLSGLVGTPGHSATEQTKEILQTAERLLKEAGSSKEHLLTVMIWLADMADFPAMNTVWDEWIADVPAPTRATGGVALASPEYRVEIIITAALA